MKKIVLLLAVVFIWSASAYGASIKNLGVGARALGMGGAFTAVADDSTAVWWNPAGLGDELMKPFQSSLVFRNVLETKITPHGNRNVNSGNLEFNFLGFSKEGFGLAYYTPYALREKASGFAVGGNYNMEYTATILSMAYGFKVQKNLSLGLSLNYIKGETDFSIDVPMAVNSDDSSFGANVGMTYYLPAQESKISLVYRSGCPLDAGKFVYDVPQSASIGYSKRLSNNLTSSLDLEYTRWTDVFNDPKGIKFKNKLDYRLGIEKLFVLEKNVVIPLRFGIYSAYDPDTTLPKSESEVFFSLGSGYNKSRGIIEKSKGYKFDVAFEFGTKSTKRLTTSLLVEF